MMRRIALLSAGVGLAVIGAASAQSDAPAPSMAQHNCVLKTLRTCKAEGNCAPLDNLKGEKLPVKVTVDVAAGIIAGIDPEGWVDATRIASLARAGDQLVLQGIDNAVAWQLLIHEQSQLMSFSPATADTASVGFGSCTMVKD
jgi:hypothetical protein